MIIRNKFNGYINGNNRLYPGGGGGQSQPTQTSQSTTTIPEYARPYVERMLGRAEAFSETPYQPYGGQRIAEFSPLQQQAFQGAAELGPAQQVGAGTQMAGAAGLGGLGAGQQYAQQATSPYAVGAYMSPFMETALAPQLREARRQSDITGQQLAGQAVRAGAFGGSRFGIMEAERQRNLAQQQADIYSRGMQTAYEQARQAQQFGADLGLRGYGLAGQMAGTLGQLGQTQFGQQQGAIQAQAAAGAQQQAQEQQKLSQAYQDFLTQRGHRQQQLSFMSDILRGVPLGQQTQVQYQAPPPMASQLAQLGLGAYGFSQLARKDGGVIKGYAEGGIADAAPQGSVPNTMPIDKLRSMLGDMSDEQLDQVARDAGDATTLALVQEQKNLNERIRNAGILAASMPETTIKDEIINEGGGIDTAPIPASMFADTAVGEREEAPPQEEMARGGIVAFAKGKEVKAAEPKPASPDYVSQIAAMDPTKAFATPEERSTSIKEGLKELEDYLGRDRSIELAEKIAKASELGPEAESQAKAAAAFEAMAAFGEPVPFATAVGRAGAAAGRNIKEYQRLKREADREANKLRLDTARYERAEKRGNFNEAQKYADRMENRKEKLYSLQSAQKTTLADIQLKQEKMAQELQIAREGFQVQREGIAASRAAQFNLDREVFNAETQKGIEDYRTKFGKDPVGQDLANIRANAATKAAEMRRFNPYGGPNIDIRLQSEITDRIAKDDTLKRLRYEYMTASDADKPAIEAKIEARRQVLTAEVMQGVRTVPSAPTTTTLPPAAPPKYEEGATSKDKTGKPIIFRNGRWEYIQ